MKKDNKGTSLVELIIVMAILSVLVGATVWGVGLISGKPADECANKLKVALQNNKITTMGKLDANLKIYVNAEGYICIDETIVTGSSSGDISNTTTTIIGDKGVEVTFKISGSSFVYKLSENPLYISFDRSSGAFNRLPGDKMGSAFEDKYCVEIEITKGSKVVVLKLSTLTGKVTLQ